MSDNDMGIKSIIAIFGGLMLVFMLVNIVQASTPQPPPGAYACPYCSETFNTLEELQEHVRTQHPGQPIPIEIVWQ